MGVLSVTLTKMLVHLHSVVTIYGHNERVGMPRLFSHHGYGSHGEYGRYSTESGSSQVTELIDQKGAEATSGSFEGFKYREWSGSSPSGSRCMSVRESVSGVTLACAR